MGIPVKKLKNGFEMPVFGLGTYGMGASDDQKDIAAIKTAIEAGVFHIDTAESYADGHCEEIVGEAIKDYNRSKLFVVSKVQEDHLNYANIKSALKHSLERMGTDYLDLYLMHRCPKEERFKECVQAMNELVDGGLVKHIGLSNTNTKHASALCKLTKYPFVVNQVHYNLQFREPEKDGLVEFCQKNDLFLEAWRPVNKGALTKTGTDITKPGIPLLDEICKKYGKTPAQVSINWLVSQANVITLAKSGNINHLKDNLGALDWKLSVGDIERLRNEFPDQHYISDTVALA